MNVLERTLRDTLQALELGELGDTFVPRSIILGYNLIPTDLGKSPEEKKVIYRMNSLMDLYYFSTVVLKKNRFNDTLHRQMCLTVMKDGLKEGIEIPRDHFKSTVYSECFPIWRALPFGNREADLFSNVGYSDLFIEWMRRTHSQDIRILLVSETIKNAIKLGTRISNQYTNNRDFRELFPEIMPTEKETWTNESMHQKRTLAGLAHGGDGTFDFIGVGGALQSRHYDVIVQDDLVGREARKSALVMQDTIDYHQVLVGATDNNPNNPGRDFDEIVVGNRWSHDDLNSHIRVEEPYFSWTTHSALGGCCSLHPFGVPIFPEAFTREKLLRWKRRLGSYHFSCFAAGTSILMANLDEKNIEDLKVGDEIVGYSTSGYLTMQKAAVVAVNVRKSLVCEFITASGRIIRCTPDHQFLKTSHREAERGGSYAPILDLTKQRGNPLAELASVYTPPSIPTPEEQRDLDWFGGIMDGEGTCGVSAQVVVSQSITINPEVHSEIGATLNRLKIPWVYVEQSNQFTVQGGKSLKVRLLKYAKMAKRQRFIDGWWARPGRVMEDGGYDQVIKMNVIGEMNVYNIQSSTGNYIAAGYATKNCQFLNYPIDPTKSRFNMADFRYFNFFKDTTALAAPKELSFKHARLFDIAPVQNYRTAIRHHVADGDVEKDIYPRNLQRAMIVDPNHGGSHLGAEAGKGGRCRHAIVVTGVSKDPRRIYLLDQWAEACSIDKFVARIFLLACKWKLRSIHVEAVASQKYLLYHLNYFIEQHKHSRPELVGIQIIPLKTPQTADAKMERIENFIPIVERHELWLDVDNCREFKEEAEQLGQRKGLIDLLDVISYGPQIWKFDTVSKERVDEFLSKQMAQYRRRVASAVA